MIPFDETLELALAVIGTLAGVIVAWAVPIF